MIGLWVCVLFEFTLIELQTKVLGAVIAALYSLLYVRSLECAFGFAARARVGAGAQILRRGARRRRGAALRVRGIAGAGHMAGRAERLGDDAEVRRVAGNRIRSCYYATGSRES